MYIYAFILWLWGQQLGTLTKTIWNTFKCFPVFNNTYNWFCGDPSKSIGGRGGDRTKIENLIFFFIYTSIYHLIIEDFPKWNGISITCICPCGFAFFSYGGQHFLFRFLIFHNEKTGTKLRLEFSSGPLYRHALVCRCACRFM